MVGPGSKFTRKKEEGDRGPPDPAKCRGSRLRARHRHSNVDALAQSARFQTAFREARRAASSQSIARLQQASSAAATTLMKVMLDPSSPASTRVRAADSVLGHAAKAIEIEDIEACVAALEEVTQK